MAERLAHVLIHLFVLCGEDHCFWMVQVHEEAIFGQQFLLLDCRDTDGRGSGTHQAENPLMGRLPFSSGSKLLMILEASASVAFSLCSFIRNSTRSSGLMKPVVVAYAP